ncbi:unnamed protein product [Mycena citricolor]|uniref:Methyltransferase domain-containing protein n=1 Tax=Mycena citricolor TaxID=2018698 RepID=A0AAD2HMG3_9AGAR|nr:unnamed protein product [Mycena citricolor]
MSEAPVASLPIAQFRPYQNYPGSEYILPTDEVEKLRLRTQHDYLKRLFDNKVLFAPVALGPDDKVLESGTGPGLWILELAGTTNPATHMIGLDIESRLWPASHPENVKFQLGSVTKLPEEWSNTFSLVHQRLLILGLQIPEWPTALAEMHRVLRPGGWVQIAEATLWAEGSYPGRPCMEKVVTLYRRICELRSLYVDCAYDMPKLLHEAGFVDIQKETRDQCMGSWGGPDGEVMRLNHVGVLRGIKTPVLQAGGFGIVSSEAEFDELLDGLDKEWEENPGMTKEFMIFWARKSSASS